MENNMCFLYTSVLIDLIDHTMTKPSEHALTTNSNNHRTGNEQTSPSLNSFWLCRNTYHIQQTYKSQTPASFSASHDWTMPWIQFPDYGSRCQRELFIHVLWYLKVRINQKTMHKSKAFCHATVLAYYATAVM